MGKRGEEGGVPEGGREGGDRLDGKRKAGRYAFFELGVGGRGGLREQIMIEITKYDISANKQPASPFSFPLLFPLLTFVVRESNAVKAAFVIASGVKEGEGKDEDADAPFADRSLESSSNITNSFPKILSEVATEGGNLSPIKVQRSACTSPPLSSVPFTKPLTSHISLTSSSPTLPHRLPSYLTDAAGGTPRYTA